MIEELKKKIENINDVNNIKAQMNRTKNELIKMKKNIDNIIFCRLQKENKKNNQILMNKNINLSEEILLMRALTQLNIIPLDLPKNNSYKYLYFLLSKNKAKNINAKIKPKEFWKSLIKFRE